MYRNRCASIDLPRLATILLAAALLSCTSSAPDRGGVVAQAATFNAADARAAIEEVAMLIERDFIYPDIGRRYASALREKVAKGAYDRSNNAEELARTVTADLQQVHREGHLRVLPPDVEPQGTASPAKPAQPKGVGKTEWLAPGVAYIELHGFSGSSAELDRLRAVLEELSTAKTVVLDARGYLGGGPREADVVFSHVFAQPATLLWMDTRRDVEQRGGSPMKEGPTLQTIPGPEGIVRRAWSAVPVERDLPLKHATLFVLTSKDTASAGEAFALALKRTGRATLIGETTAGAGHFGRTVALPGGYRAFIPVGRPFDPDTGKGWEQTGVEPHVAVPAERALEEALRRAGVRRAT